MALENKSLTEALDNIHLGRIGGVTCVTFLMEIDLALWQNWGYGKMVLFKIIARQVKVFFLITFFCVKNIPVYIFEKFQFILTKKRKPSSIPKQFRLLLERLQYTFVKLGQILAMRPDLLPHAYCMELMKLLDDVPPFEDDRAVEIIEEELGKNINSIFQHFDKRHISAASFGQVYRAILHSGEKVVIKVRRPGIKPIVYTELALINLLASVIDFSFVLGTFRLKPFLADFAVYTKEELNYLIEARNVQKMYNSAVDNSLERIPRVYHEYTTAKVLTLEFLDGVWISDILRAIGSKDKEKLAEYNNRGINLNTVAKNILLNSMIQPFEKDYFHADPHAANICAMENNVIGYVDFGIVGKMDKRQKEKLLLFLEALYKEDVNQAYSLFLDIVMPPSNLDLTDFEKEMKDLLSTWLEAASDPRALYSERSTLRRIIKEGNIMRKYNIALPEITSRFYRSMMISEMAILQLDPTIDIVNIRYKYFYDLIIKNWKEKIARQNILEILLQTLYVIASLPNRIDKMLSRSEELITGTGKAISNLRIFPSAILGFLGKLGLITSLIGFVLRLILRMDFQFRFLSKSFDLLEISVFLFLGSIISLWLSKFLIIK